VTLDPKQFVFLAVIAVSTDCLHSLPREITDRLIGNMRGGGPRPPSHPLPGDDGFIVRRKRRRAVSDL
jgi:hypothetical protein